MVYLRSFYLLMTNISLGIDFIYKDATTFKFSIDIPYFDTMYWFFMLFYLKKKQI